MKRLLLIRIILFLAFALSASFASLAQGWSFTMTLMTSGPCGVTLPYIPTFTIPYMTSKSQCESVRQSILDISASQPMYDSENHYLGLCTVFYSCTPCSGADISGTSESEFGAGDISVDGPAQGKPFFSPHESKDVENWMSDYILRLNSMSTGMVDLSVLDMNGIPLTGNSFVDEYYIRQSMEFEKTALADINKKPDESPKPADPPPTEPYTVSTDIISGMEEENPGIGNTVMLLTTNEDIARQAQWMKDHGLSEPVQIGNDRNIDREGVIDAVMSHKEDLLREYVSSETAGNFALKTLDGTIQGMTDAIQLIKSNDNAGAIELGNSLAGGSVAINAFKETAREEAEDMIVGGFTGPVMGLVEGAETAVSVVETSKSVWDIIFDKNK